MIGIDGHTASLFSEFEKSFFSSQPFTKVKRSSEAFSRISVSANVLIDDPQIFSLVSGPEKRTVLRKILENSNEKGLLPVQTILNKAKGKVMFLCDSKVLAA